MHSTCITPDVYVREDDCVTSMHSFLGGLLLREFFQFLVEL